MTIQAQCSDDFARAIESVNNELFLGTIDDVQALDEYTQLFGDYTVAYDYWHGIVSDQLQIKTNKRMLENFLEGTRELE